MTKNKYGISDKKQWSSFTDEAKKVYNDVMDRSLKNQHLFSHPEMPAILKEQWETICHNFAAAAAYSVSGKPLKKGEKIANYAGETDAFD